MNNFVIQEITQILDSTRLDSTERPEQRLVLCLKIQPTNKQETANNKQ